GGDHLADVRLVIDEQHAGAHAAVSTMENVAPPPGVSATVMLPLWYSIVWRTRASPRPVPSCLVVKYGSNTRWRRSSGIPAPWSAIVTASPFPSRLTAISIDPRPPIASEALRNRFANARRSGSSCTSSLQGSPLPGTHTSTAAGTRLLPRPTRRPTHST